MAEPGLRPLSDSLGLPDVFPHLPVRRHRHTTAAGNPSHLALLVAPRLTPRTNAVQRSQVATAAAALHLLCSTPQGCAEDSLTPDVLQHGYRHSEAAAVGLTPQRELALTLTDQPPGFYSPASLAYWRKVGPEGAGREVSFALWRAV